MSKVLLIRPLYFQGTIVAVKKIDKSKFNLNRDLLIELKTVSHRFLSQELRCFHTKIIRGFRYLIHITGQNTEKNIIFIFGRPQVIFTSATFPPNSRNLYLLHIQQSTELQKKPLLKIRPANAIFWIFLDTFRHYGLKNIFQE